MKAKLHHLFPSVVYQTQLHLDKKPIQDYCSYLNKSFKSVAKSNYGGWQSPLINNYSIKTSPLSKLSKEIEKHANVFKDTFLLKKPMELCHLWANINNYKDYNIDHSHPLVTLSGVYYVKVPSTSGPLKFIHPGADLMFRDWYGVEKENYTQCNCEEWLFEPKENMLFLFPSWLRHGVLPQLNKEERVSLSFNLK
tara:strand:- start:1268 stop:1852 length:585 start_codon:yes stop_codon:yes gene_type:complete